MSAGSQHLRQLAVHARPTGSAAIREARSYCDRVLTGLGFTVTERAFQFSAFPGNYGTPLVGAFVAGVVSLAACVSARGLGTAALATLVVGLTVAGLAGRHLARSGVLSLPIMRREGVNLEAVRGSMAPTVWLVAHVDSKGQPIPTALRAAGIVLLALATMVAVAAAVVHASTGRSISAWPGILVATWVGAVPVMLSFIIDRGTGAVDNASGVATVLAAAEQLPRDARVGVLITDAEELGLAGARAWLVGRPRAVALNCDGVDDTGVLTLMYSGRTPTVVAKALRDAATAGGDALRVMRVVPGVLTDSVAFSEAGWEAATLSRGAFRTLARIHTASDTLGTLDGTGIASSATVLSRAATGLS